MMSDNTLEEIGKECRTGNGESSTIETSLSTLLLEDPQDMFNQSITDLDSFSKSLDFDRHLPSKEDREDFLGQFLEEEEINPEESFTSSFAYDMECSIPTQLGTILDQTEEDEDDDWACQGGDALSRSNHLAATAKA